MWVRMIFFSFRAIAWVEVVEKCNYKMYEVTNYSFISILESVLPLVLNYFGDSWELGIFFERFFFNIELLIVKFTGYLLNISLTFQPWYLRNELKDFEVSITIA